jgi:NADP-dependent 3-hydroxy acid dehydrogenase YdfG
VASGLLTDYWTGKSVVITGASSGIGAALVQALAPYRVYFCLLSRRKDPMDELAERLAYSGSHFWIRSCDVRNRSEVENAVEDYLKAAGRLDVVWANSGIAGDTSYARWDWDTVERILDTNLKGAIYTIHACLRHMVPQNSGTVVAISSAAAMRGLPARSLYSLTKIGLAYYMESLAAELPQIQFTTILSRLCRYPHQPQQSKALLGRCP